MYAGMWEEIRGQEEQTKLSLQTVTQAKNQTFMDLACILLFIS